MALDRTLRIQTYLGHLGSANNEQVKKELLLALLKDLFGRDAGACETLDAMILGAEKAIPLIPLEDRIKTGRADTQYGSVIIEFENELRKTGEHARDQLAEYLAGNWRAGDDYRFTLISTDCREWRVYAPRWEDVGAGFATARDLDLKLTASITLTPDNTEDFYLFLDQYLFATEPRRPTLEAIERDFGETSRTFITSLGVLQRHYGAARGEPSVQVAFEQWRRFLSIAYGDFGEREDQFLVHTYLSVFAKVLAYEVLTADTFIDDAELRGILTGDIFDRLNVRGFVGRDFFGWVAHEPHYTALRPLFREVTRAVGRFDFSKGVDEDVLKGVYQELIDLDTRHALGEYYTPDWLCERVTAAFPFTPTTTVLDPACGSGSFLRAAVAQFHRQHPTLGPGDIARRVVGIDIHPLSVLIAKTTLLLALGRDVRNARHPVALRVYLANTLRTPEGTVGDLFGTSFTVAVDAQTLRLSTRVLADPPLFEAAIAAAEDLAEDTRGQPDVDAGTLAKTIGRRLGAAPPDAALAADFHRLYRALKNAKEAGRDGIWKFIVQNLYQPFFLRDKVDVVLGNPPWLTYAGVKVASYQDELRSLAQKYGVAPERQANMPHLEIAAIFQAHAASAFLRKGGRMGLVMPRAFLSADHHAALRSGRAENVRLTEIWDLDGVAPLFRVPACVLISEKAWGNVRRTPPTTGLPGYHVAGRLPTTGQAVHNLTWDEARPHLAFEPATWYVGRLGARTAFTRRKPGRAGGGEGNAYKDAFRQGATLVPRNAYFVRPTGNAPDFDDRELTIATDEEATAQAKAPWKDYAFSGRVHSRFLFRTAMAKSLLPFVLFEPELVVLPLARDADGALALLSPADLRRDGERDTARYFADVETVWEKLKTQRNENTTFLEWLDWQGKLSNQHLGHRWLVLYSSSAKDANACVVEQGSLDLPFVVDHVTYWAPAQSEAEAYYLAAFLNADEPNRLIKDYQPRGLMGARHVHKLILDAPLPRFDPADDLHAALSALGQEAARRARAWADALPPPAERPNLGQLRLDLRAALAPELARIDAVLRQVV